MSTDICTESTHIHTPLLSKYTNPINATDFHVMSMSNGRICKWPTHEVLKAPQNVNRICAGKLIMRKESRSWREQIRRSSWQSWHNICIQLSHWWNRRLSNDVMWLVKGKLLALCPVRVWGLEKVTIRWTQHPKICSVSGHCLNAPPLQRCTEGTFCHWMGHT